MTRAFLLLLGAASAVAFAEDNTRKGEPGRFDYYVYALSWSPHYCSNHDDPVQCLGTRRYAFVVHGLWPQYEKRWPEFCQTASTVPAPMAESMLDIMPSTKLIQHEWDKHGTCSGLDQKGYFAAVRELWGTVKIPKDYQQPLKQVVHKPARIRQSFLSANKGLKPDSVKLVCSGRYLSEVRICMTRDFKGRSCAADVRDTCKAREVILRPVR